MLWVVTPIIYFGDIWDARSFPSAVSAGLFNNNFTRFDVHSVLTPALTLNETAFETAGPLLLTPYFAITYALSFASLTSVIAHVYLFHGTEIRAAFTKGRRGEADEDVHNRLMQRYDEVPRRWYVAIGVACLLASLALVVLTPELQVRHAPLPSTPRLLLTCADLPAPLSSLHPLRRPSGRFCCRS